MQWGSWILDYEVHPFLSCLQHRFNLAHFFKPLSLRNVWSPCVKHRWTRPSSLSIQKSWHVAAQVQLPYWHSSTTLDACTSLHFNLFHLTRCGVSRGYSSAVLAEAIDANQWQGCKAWAAGSNFTASWFSRFLTKQIWVGVFVLCFPLFLDRIWECVFITDHVNW